MPDDEVDRMLASHQSQVIINKESQYSRCIGETERCMKRWILLPDGRSDYQ